MPTNYGLFIESEIAMGFNNKKISNLNRNLKYTLFSIFGPLDENEIVRSEQIKDMNKPDIWVEYKGERKYISIKSGRATEVHAELLSSFVPFLAECGLSEWGCDFVKRYCYADGTTDGTGEYAMDFFALKTHFLRDTQRFNEEVMQIPGFIEKVLKRCLFEGNHDGVPAEYIYFGDSNYGNLVSQRQIAKHLTRKDWAFMTNPHIGPLQFRAHIRGKSRNPEHEYKRHTIDLWWANLYADIDYISKRYAL